MSIEVRFHIFKDPVSAGTHFVGFLASVFALVVLVILTAHDTVKVVGSAIYGSTLVVLFLASTLYHFLDIGERGNRWLRRLDHGAIFLLIAGTYVPPLVHLLDGSWRIAMLAIISGLAVAGIIFKLFWIDAPDTLATAIYLVMGWLVVIPAYKILPQLAWSEIAWLGIGGIAYTGGALAELLDWPDRWPGVLTPHDAWHIFVLIGASAHFGFTLCLVDRPYPPF